MNEQEIIGAAKCAEYEATIQALSHRCAELAAALAVAQSQIAADKQKAEAEKVDPAA